MNKKLSTKQKIRFRIRKKINGTADKPRLSVFRSNKEIYAQLIDDKSRKTLAAASTTTKGTKITGTKTEQARQVGVLIAEKALALNIKACQFDRGGCLYHGRVKALADGAREKGLQF